jgi:hypothetical protein
MNKNNKAGIFIRILIILVLTVLIGGVLVFNFFFKTDGTPSSIFGLYFLQTGEVYMETEIMPGDMVIAVKTDPAKIKANDVVICQFDTRITVIRVIGVSEGTGADGTPTFTVKYDTVDESNAFSIGSDKIIAVAKYKDPLLGQLLGVATSVPGIIIAVIIPLTLIIIYQIARFARERDDENADSNSISEEEITKRIKERTADLTDIMAEREKRNSNSGMRLSGFTAELDPPVTPPQNQPVRNVPERKLAIDERGRAGLEDVTRQIAPGAFRRAEPVMIIKPENKPQNNSDNSESVKKTRIDDLLRENERIDDAAREILRPKPVSVIPDEITRLQQPAAKPAPSESGFEESVREYYDRGETSRGAGGAGMGGTGGSRGASESFNEPTVPEGAVTPKEKIAPTRRKRQGGTVDELMKLIDDQSVKRR